MILSSLYQLQWKKSPRSGEIFWEEIFGRKIWEENFSSEEKKTIGTTEHGKAGRTKPGQLKTRRSQGDLGGLAAPVTAAAVRAEEPFMFLALFHFSTLSHLQRSGEEMGKRPYHMNCMTYPPTQATV